MVPRLAALLTLVAASLAANSSFICASGFPSQAACWTPAPPTADSHVTTAGTMTVLDVRTYASLTCGRTNFAVVTLVDNARLIVDSLFVGAACNFILMRASVVALSVSVAGMLTAAQSADIAASAVDVSGMAQLGSNGAASTLNFGANLSVSGTLNLINAAAIARESIFLAPPSQLFASCDDSNCSLAATNVFSNGRMDVSGPRSFNLAGVWRHKGIFVAAGALNATTLVNGGSIAAAGVKITNEATLLLGSLITTPSLRFLGASDVAGEVSGVAFADGAPILLRQNATFGALTGASCVLSTAGPVKVPFPITLTTCQISDATLNATSDVALIGTTILRTDATFAALNLSGASFVLLSSVRAETVRFDNCSVTCMSSAVTSPAAVIVKSLSIIGACSVHLSNVSSSLTANLSVSGAQLSGYFRADVTLTDVSISSVTAVIGVLTLGGNALSGAGPLLAFGTVRIGAPLILNTSLELNGAATFDAPLTLAAPFRVMRTGSATFRSEVSSIGRGSLTVEGGVEFAPLHGVQLSLGHLVLAGNCVVRATRWETGFVTNNGSIFFSAASEWVADRIVLKESSNLTAPALLINAPTFEGGGLIDAPLTLPRRLLAVGAPLRLRRTIAADDPSALLVFSAASSAPPPLLAFDGATLPNASFASLRVEVASVPKFPQRVVCTNAAVIVLSRAEASSLWRLEGCQMTFRQGVRLFDIQINGTNSSIGSTGPTELSNLSIIGTDVTVQSAPLTAANVSGDATLRVVDGNLVASNLSGALTLIADRSRVTLQNATVRNLWLRACTVALEGGGWLRCSGEAALEGCDLNFETATFRAIVAAPFLTAVKVNLTDARVFVAAPDLPPHPNATFRLALAAFVVADASVSSGVLDNRTLGLLISATAVDLLFLGNN
jgi:hypothetical protein